MAKTIVATAPTDCRQLDRGVTHDVYVVETYALGEVGVAGIVAYEIHVAPDSDADAPRVRLVTTDETVYRRACRADGTGRRFTTTWHRAPRRGAFAYFIDRFDEI
jgi:hypothetical protein